MSLPRCDLGPSEPSTGVHSDPLESTEFLEVFWRRRETLDAVPAALFARADSRRLHRDLFGGRVEAEGPFPAAGKIVILHLAAARISTADVEVLLDAVALIVEPIRISYLWRPMLRDPGDDLVLETAVNGRADVVVTFNRRHFELAAATFGLEILDPRDAVRRLENRS